MFGFDEYDIYITALRFSLISTLMEYKINLPVTYITPLNSAELNLNLVTKMEAFYLIEILQILISIHLVKSYNYYNLNLSFFFFFSF